jgi:hypothetical protein
MPASVACPSCRAAVSVPAEHAESTIRCGICWAEVDLGVRPTTPAKPALVPPPPAAPAVAKRPAPVLAGKPIPAMAKLEERMRRAAARLAPPPAPAAPVRATVVVKPAAPLVEIAPALATIAPARVDPSPIDAEPYAELASDEPMEPPSRRSRSRGSSRRFRDDDEDRPRRRTERKSGGSPLPLVLGIGAFIVLLLGGGYLVSRAFRGPSDRDLVPIAEGDDPAIQFNLPNPDANPKQPPPPAIGFNPFPNMPNMQPPGAGRAGPVPELVAFAGDGYTAKIFSQKNEIPTFMNLQDDAYVIANVRAKTVNSRLFPPVATIDVTTADAPQDVNPDLKKILVDSSFRRAAPKSVQWAGQDGFELVEDLAGRKTTMRAVKVGCRVFIAKFTIQSAFGDARSAEAAQKDFFDSFAITFDANTPAPAAEPGLIPRKRLVVPRPPTPPRPKLPGQP